MLLTWFCNARQLASTKGMDMTFFVFLLACGAAATTGLMFQPGQWYESLAKPGFTPPKWAFPVAWTTIYLLLAWAGYRLTLIPGSQVVLALWAAQIALNTLWTPVFFGAHRLFAAMVILTVLWLVVAAMVVMAMRLDVITGLILLPYLAWLCVAAALNFSIWRNNR
jgi:tryptophan-rich sensory protein